MDTADDTISQVQPNMGASPTDDRPKSVRFGATVIVPYADIRMNRKDQETDKNQPGQDVKKNKNYSDKARAPRVVHASEGMDRSTSRKNSKRQLSSKSHSGGSSRSRSRRSCSQNSRSDSNSHLGSRSRSRSRNSRSRLSKSRFSGSGTRSSRPLGSLQKCRSSNSSGPTSASRSARRNHHNLKTTLKSQRSVLRSGKSSKKPRGSSYDFNDTPNKRRKVSNTINNSNPKHTRSTCIRKFSFDKRGEHGKKVSKNF